MPFGVGRKRDAKSLYCFTTKLFKHRLDSGVYMFHETQYHHTLIENDHLGDWRPEKDCCCRLTLRQPVRKPSTESSGCF